MKFLCCLLLFLAAPAWPNQDWSQDIKQAVRAQKKGDLKKAEDILLKALFKAEAFGEDDPRLAYTLDYLGTLNIQEHAPAKAEPMFLRSLKIFEKGEGADSSDALETCAKLGECYDEMQLWPKSEPFYKRVADSKRGDAMQQSVDLNDLAVAIDAQGRQDEALKLYAQAVDLRQSIQGPDSAGLPELFNNQARVYYMKGDYAAAEKLYLHSIAIDSAAKSPLLADDYQRLAPLYRKQGRDADAKDAESKAAAVLAANPDKAKGKQP